MDEADAGIKLRIARETTSTSSARCSSANAEESGRESIKAKKARLLGGGGEVFEALAASLGGEERHQYRAYHRPDRNNSDRVAESAQRA